MPKQVWYESGFFGGAGGEKTNIEPIWWDKWNFDYNTVSMNLFTLCKMLKIHKNMYWVKTKAKQLLIEKIISI